MLKNKNVRLYEALAHEVAMDAAERRELTDEQRETSRSLHAYAQSLVAELDRTDERKRTGVRASIAVMERRPMLSRLTEIFRFQPRAALAFRDFERMSDDDLRSALEDAESMLERLV